MGWRTHDLDPRLRKRVEDALGAGGGSVPMQQEPAQPARSPKRIRQSSKPLLNKLEQAYYDEVI
jgi:hypothetical protein